LGLSKGVLSWELGVESSKLKVLKLEREFNAEWLVWAFITF